MYARTHARAHTHTHTHTRARTTKAIRGEKRKKDEKIQVQLK